MRRDDARQMAKIFANFTFFANIQNQLESGCLYTATGSSGAAEKIIAICEKEKNRLYLEYETLLPLVKITRSKDKSTS